MPASSAEAARAGRWPAPRRGSPLKPALALATAFIGLSLLWNLPIAFSGFGWPWLATAALEVALAFALLALAPRLRAGWPGRLAAGLLALLTTLVVASKLAELVMRETLARPLNPLVDVQLARSLVDLLTEALGGVLGWLCIAGLAIAALALCALVWAAVRATQWALERPFARHATLAASANCSFAVNVNDPSCPANAPISNQLWQQSCQ